MGGLLGKIFNLKDDSEFVDFYQNKVFQGDDDIWMNNINKTGLLRAGWSGKDSLQTAWNNMLDPNYDRGQLQKDWAEVEGKYNMFQPEYEQKFLDRVGNMQAGEWSPLQTIAKKFS